MAEKRQKTPLERSIKRIIPLLLIIVGVFFIIKTLQSKGVPIGFSSTYMNPAEDYRKLKLFTSEEAKDAAKKNNAGFYESYIVKSGFRIKDRLEVKDNGIIWQIRQYTLFTPNNDSAMFTHIRTAYVNPYGRRDTTKTPQVAETQIISQVALTINDTCYGKSKLDEIWQTDKKADSTFTIGEIIYTPYKGTLDTFFPPNLTTLTEKISINPCGTYSDFASFTRKILKEKFATPSIESLDPLAIMTIISSYYEPLLLGPLMHPFLVGRGKPTDSLIVDFTILNTGTVSNVFVRKSNFTRKKFETAVSTEIASWLFPQPKDKKPLTMSYTIKY